MSERLVPVDKCHGCKFNKSEVMTAYRPDGLGDIFLLCDVCRKGVQGGTNSAVQAAVAAKVEEIAVLIEGEGWGWSKGRPNKVMLRLAAEIRRKG
jgi:hypothetical protein